MSTSRGDERVDREQAQRRRAVDEDVVVRFVHLGEVRVECAAEALLARDERHELDLGAGEVDGGGNAVELLVLGGWPDDVGEREVGDQHVVDALLVGTVVDAEGRRRVALRVEVDHEHVRAGAGQCGGEVHRGRGLADAALLVGDREDPWRGQGEHRLLEREPTPCLVGELIGQGSSSVGSVRFT